MTTATVNRLGWHGTEPPPDWVIPDFCARGAVTIIAGEAGAGKSLLLIGLMVGAIRRGLRITDIDAENGRAVVKRRLDPYKLTHEEKAMLRVYIADSFDIQRDVKKVKSLARGSDILVLDSWVSLWGGSELSVRQVKECLEGLRDIARELNCGIVLIHHTTKSGKSYRGSGSIAGTVEMLFTLTKEMDKQTDEDTGIRRLHCVKMRIEEEPGDRFIKLGDGGRVSEVGSTEGMAWMVLRPAIGPLAWRR